MGWSLAYSDVTLQSAVDLSTTDCNQHETKRLQEGQQRE